MASMYYGPGTVEAIGTKYCHDDGSLTRLAMLATSTLFHYHGF